MQKLRKPQSKITLPRTLWMLLAGAVLLRLVLAAVTEAYPYDLNCFLAWGAKLVSEGPANFYSEGYFADYPPGYIWVLGLVAWLRELLNLEYSGGASQMLLAVVPSLCDGVIAALVWHISMVSQPEDPKRALRMAAFTAFCPLLLYNTAVWEQIDGAFMLPMALCFWWLEEKRYLPAAFAYGVALAIKPQALLGGPVLAVCFLAGVVDAVKEDKTAVGRAVGRIFAGIGLALVTPLVLAVPFFGVVELLPRLLEKYFGTMSSYRYASVNAFNWLAALGGNWKGLDETISGTVLRWQAVGTLGIVLATAAMLALAVLAYRKKRFSPLLLAGFYTTAIFTFSHQMHERYLVLGVVLVLLAAARWKDRGLYGAAFGLSLTGLVNLATVYTLVYTDDQWMGSATSTLVVRWTGLAQTACFALLAASVLDVIVRGETATEKSKPIEPPVLPTAQPAWTRKEVAFLLALTAATGVISFAYLGELTAPQSLVDVNGGQTVTYTAHLLPAKEPLAELWVYPGISQYNNGTLTVTDANGDTVMNMDLIYTSPFKWVRRDLSNAGPGPYTITVTDGQMIELCFRDAGGNKMALDNMDYATPLFDEQHLVPDTISQLNSFYFDEIYHARTGYEQLHRMPVYETTHPPLGKDLIMLGIAIFGMTGFGWRFSGTLFGVLLVPLAWLFARRLTRKTWLGALAGALMALDLMRFAQSRIATIDTYGTFFILLGAYFMLWYCQSVLEKGVLDSMLPMALGGAAFGLGCAAKWTGLYAGAGLAVLYLGVLWKRWQQKPKNFWQEFRTAALGGVAFYVLLPLGIYTASYLPYTWRDPGFGLNQLWQCQLTMYNYHSGLEATHSFESRWYTWLLGLRPVWYYSNGDLPAGMRGTIAGLAGPVIWVGGLVAIILLLWRQVSGKATATGAGVLILYAAQLLPWMLVTRCTFLYHYFPSSVFCLAALVLVLAHMKEEQKAKRIGAALCVAALVVFVCYYPAVSGLPVSTKWIEALKVLPSFGF